MENDTNTIIVHLIKTEREREREREREKGRGRDLARERQTDRERERDKERERESEKETETDLVDCSGLPGDPPRLHRCRHQSLSTTGPAEGL